MGIMMSSQGYIHILDSIEFSPETESSCVQALSICIDVFDTDVLWDPLFRLFI